MNSMTAYRSRKISVSGFMYKYNSYININVIIIEANESQLLVYFSQDTSE